MVSLANYVSKRCESSATDELASSILLGMGLKRLVRRSIKTNKHLTMCGCGLYKTVWGFWPKIRAAAVCDMKRCHIKLRISILASVVLKLFNLNNLSVTDKKSLYSVQHSSFGIHHTMQTYGTLSTFACCTVMDSDNKHRKQIIKPVKHTHL